MTSPTRVPFVDLTFQWEAIKENALPELTTLIESSAFVLGPYVSRFEKNIANYLGTGNAVGVNSGTSALHLALIAAGIGPGDKVLIPAMSFIATAWPVLYVGGIPVFCDVEEATGNIDMRDVEKRMESGVKAIIPVHLYGQSSNMDLILEFAKEHNLAVVEDAAQAIGAQYGGQTVGTLGHFGCFSFYPSKNLGASGEAGLVITNDNKGADRLRSLRHHGQTAPNTHSEVGYNYRMDGMQGLILDHKLDHIAQWTLFRKRIARLYIEGLSSLPLELPHPHGADHVYHLFVVRTKMRDALQRHLSDRGLQTGLHYPISMHRQPALAGYAPDLDSYPTADRYANEGLSLPIFFGMTDEQVQIVIDEIIKFFSTTKNT